MPARLELTGQRFGKLLVDSFSHSNRFWTFWNCTCDCGRKVNIQGRNLRSGGSRSCGICPLEKHGLAKSPIYRVWRGMLSRCMNIKNPDYHNYGGRGIKVCDRWYDVTNFAKDMFPTWSKGLTLDRIDVNGNYEPSNCRWATPSKNAKNKRTKAEYQSDIDYVIYNKKDDTWLVVNRFKTKEAAEKFATVTRGYTGER